MAEMRLMKDRYYKNAARDVKLISGLPLPKDEDGVVRNVLFKGCDFHPSCGEVVFEGCEFVDCQGVEWLERRRECV
jgi:hypothetical protein